MDEQKKYEVIKKLVDSQGNKDRAAIALGITRRQVDRLIIAYKQKGKAAFVHGNRGRKPAITTPDEVRRAVVDLYRTKYYEANFVHFSKEQHGCSPASPTRSGVCQKRLQEPVSKAADSNYQKIHKKRHCKIQAYRPTPSHFQG